MAKVLLIEISKCHGCRQCELACSMCSGVTKRDSFRARLGSFCWDLEGCGVVITCQQCESPACKVVCPQTAIYRNEKLNSVAVDYNKCIGCRMCVSACPIGAIDFDKTNKRVIKCDLCDGDPLCVTFCSYGALQYVEEEHSHPEFQLKSERSMSNLDVRRR